MRFKNQEEFKIKALFWYWPTFICWLKEDVRVGFDVLRVAKSRVLDVQIDSRHWWETDWKALV